MSRHINDGPARWELHEHTEQERRELRMEADDEVVMVRASWATAADSLRARCGLTSCHSVVSVLLPEEARELRDWLSAVLVSWGEASEA